MDIGLEKPFNSYSSFLSHKLRPKREYYLKKQLFVLVAFIAAVDSANQLRKYFQPINMNYVAFRSAYF